MGSFPDFSFLFLEIPPPPPKKRGLNGDVGDGRGEKKGTSSFPGGRRGEEGRKKGRKEKRGVGAVGRFSKFNFFFFRFLIFFGIEREESRGRAPLARSYS